MKTEIDSDLISMVLKFRFASSAHLSPPKYPIIATAFLTRNFRLSLGAVSINLNKSSFDKTNDFFFVDSFSSFFQKMFQKRMVIKGIPSFICGIKFV